MTGGGSGKARNLFRRRFDVDKAARTARNRQQPFLLWFTGLSGAGKSTVADLVEKRLHAMERRTYILDGDNLRHGLNRDLGFTDADRVENTRRIAEVAKLFIDAGMIVLVAIISPFRSERRFARDLLERDEFIEVYVEAPLEICEARDPKGLYARARAGAIANFTGISSPYQAPEDADITLPTAELAPDAAAEKVIRALQARGRI